MCSLEIPLRHTISTYNLNAYVAIYCRKSFLPFYIYFFIFSKITDQLSQHINYITYIKFLYLMWSILLTSSYFVALIENILPGIFFICCLSKTDN